MQKYRILYHVPKVTTIKGLHYSASIMGGTLFLQCSDLLLSPAESPEVLSRGRSPPPAPPLPWPRSAPRLAPSAPPPPSPAPASQSHAPHTPPSQPEGEERGGEERGGKGRGGEGREGRGGEGRGGEGRVEEMRCRKGDGSMLTITWTLCNSPCKNPSLYL